MASFILFTTSDFGYKVCEYIYKNYEVKAIVTSTPKPKGRHLVIEDIDTIKKAKEYNIPVIYVDKSNEIFSKIKDIIADYFLVVDFAFILKDNVLKLPLKFPINIHPSILPKYRGPSPLHYQIIDNVKKSGISIIKMNNKVDEGDLLFQLTFELEEWYSFSKFYDFMQENALLTFEIFMNNITLLYSSPQDNKEATYTKKIEKKDAIIDFENEYSSFIVGKIKAFEKWPKVKIKIDDDIIILLDAKINKDFSIKPGHLFIDDNRFIIGTKDGAIEILKLQRPGKSIQSAKTFLKGYRKRFIEKTIESELNI